MKGLIKLFSAVAFVGALASCSDDLSLSKANLDPNADLYATLPEVETTRMGVLEDQQVVWSEGDVINVYSANSLKFDRYELTSGAGESTASFAQKKPDNGVASLGNLVAVSSSEFLKGVHATEKGEMQLIAKIPANFTQNEEIGDDQETVYWPLAIPYWANNVSFSGKQLNANMKALTGLLKINIKDLPEGTKAIVLNTHYFAYTSDDDYANKENMLGGSDEALSGTLTTVLEDGAALEVDEDYRHADTLRVEIDELDKDQDKTIFVPVIAGHYDKLTVLAVSEDSKNPYVWPKAEVLRVFEDLDVTTKWAGSIAQTATYEYNGPSTKAEDLSKWIAEKIINDGQHTIKVKVNVSISEGTLYIMNNPEIKQSSVDIEFTEKSGANFDIVEAFANYNPEMSGWKTLSTSMPWQDIPAAPYIYGIKSLDKARTATITFADEEANNHKIILPSSNVVLKEAGAATGTMFILGANTREVSGYTDAKKFAEDKNFRNAGITIRGSWGYIQIHPNQFGHVYANGDGEDDEILYLEFQGKMNRTSTTAYITQIPGLQRGNDSSIDLRVTDMLINTINYLDLGGDAESNIYTTGNSAIKAITETSWGHLNKVNLNASWTSQKLSDYALNNGYDQKEIFTAAQLSSMGLASLRKSEGAGITTDSPYDYYMSDRTRSVWLGGKKFPWIGADVTIRNAGKVASITSAFKFDAKNCNFRNMYFDLYEPYLPIDCCCDGPRKIAVDEGLGLIRRIDTESTADIKNVNLTDALMDAHRFNIRNIGSICGRITATGKITLIHNLVDCIRIDANGRNIGGAFGWLNSDAEVEIETLHVGENSSIYGKTWVTSKSKNVGGAVGAITGDEVSVPTYSNVYGGTNKTEIAWTPTPIVKATDVIDYEEFVISEDDNVGGQVGLIHAKTLTYGTDAMDGNLAHINDKVRTIGSQVGGLIGHVMYDDNTTLVRGKVEVGNEIYAEFTEKRTEDDNSNMSGQNVGGLVGRMFIFDARYPAQQDNITTIEGDVRVDGYVIAENRNAGGFVGYYEGNKLQTGNSDKTNSVKIGKRLEAIEGYVGGLYGILNTADAAQIGRNTAAGKIYIGHKDKSSEVVGIGEIAGAMAVGGLIGASNNGSATTANDKQLQIVSNADKKYYITLNIPKWTNTKNGNVIKTAFTRPDYVSPCENTVNNSVVFNPFWFTATAQQKYAGSFGTVIGWLNNVISIADTGLDVADQTGVLEVFSRTNTSYWGAPEFTSENPIFTNDKKVNLLFRMQHVSQATQPEEAITGQGTMYWGDENGYVGVCNNSSAGSGAYKLNGNTLKGDTNYNLYYDWATNLFTTEW